MSGKADEANLLKETARSLDRFWFGFGSPTAIGVFRIIFGFLTFLNLVLLAFDWETWYSERGFVPSWLGQRWLYPKTAIGFGTNWSIPRINVLNGVTNDRISLLVFLITALAALLTTLGLWTRISSIVLAVGIVSLHHRNPIILHGGDSVIRVMCLYMAIAPSGAACSLDRVIGLIKGRISGAPILVSLWPQRLIAYNMALIYLTTTWEKWGGHLWQNGTATWYPVRLAEFYRFPVPDFINQMPFVTITTYGTLFVEFALGTLVFFRPLRNYVLLSGLFLHFWIDYSMNIPLFSYLMSSMYISFYDGEEILDWADRLGRKRKKWHLNVYMPSGFQLSKQAVAFLESVDVLKLIHFLPGDREEWAAEGHDGTSYPLRSAIWRRCPGCWLLAWSPGFWTWFETRTLEPLESEGIPTRKNKRGHQTP